MKIKPFAWTQALKRQARKELLVDVNHYELKQRTRLVGVRFYPNGTARYIGLAHDYTTDATQF